MAKDEGSQPLTAEELRWLSTAPADSEDRPRGWSLSQRQVKNQRWSEPLVHEGVDFRGVTFESMDWSNATFRNCRFFEVRFRGCNLSSLRLNYVLFDRCEFERCKVSSSHFERCTIGACTIGKVEFRRCAFVNSQLLKCSTIELGLQACSIERTPLRDLKLEGFHADGLRGELAVTGGRLSVSRIANAELESLQLEGVEVEGFTLLDCVLGRVSFSAGQLNHVACSGCRVDGLRAEQVTESLGLTLTETKFGSLSVEDCPAVHLMLVADCEVAGFEANDSSFCDLAFERSEIAEAKFEGGLLMGAAFEGGSWGRVCTSQTTFADYLLLRDVHFESLTHSDPRVEEGWALEERGVSYGEASMSWKDAQDA